MPAESVASPEKTPVQGAQPKDEPPVCVIIHNDDITPMDFVIHVLATVFLLPSLNAAQVMYAAHLNGEAVVEKLPAAEARRRIGQAHFAARLRGFPLLFTMEPA